MMVVLVLLKCYGSQLWCRGTDSRHQDSRPGFKSQLHHLLSPWSFVLQSLGLPESSPLLPVVQVGLTCPGVGTVPRSSQSRTHQSNQNDWFSYSCSSWLRVPAGSRQNQSHFSLSLLSLLSLLLLFLPLLLLLSEKALSFPLGPQL